MRDYRRTFVLAALLAALMPLLVEYIKEKGESPFLMSLAEDTRNMAAWYPST